MPGHDITVSMTQSGVPSSPRYNDHYDDLARLWISAEQRANPDLYVGLDFKGLLSVARDRCIAICSGEVRYSETGAGDRQVWHGRPRSRLWDDMPVYMDSAGKMHKARGDAELANSDIEQAMRKRSGKEVSAGSLGSFDPVDIDWSELRRPGGGVREFAWVNVYDTIEFVGDGNIETFFGNQNIGNVFLTNMQVAGQFSGNSRFIADTFYVVPKKVAGDLEIPWDDAVVEMYIGARCCAGPMILADAFVGYTAELQIPSRSNFGARIYLRRPCPGLRVRCHLEGILERNIA